MLPKVGAVAMETQMSKQEKGAVEGAFLIMSPTHGAVEHTFDVRTCVVAGQSGQ